MNNTQPISNSTIVKTIGELKILDSGVIHTKEEKKFSFELFGDKFSFVLKRDSGESRYEVNIVNDNEAEIVIFNHNNPLGTAVIDPIGIATYDDGQNLYFSYYVNAITSNLTSLMGYRFEYVFYVGK